MEDISLPALLRTAREDAIRECIEVLPSLPPLSQPHWVLEDVYVHDRKCREALESLLPKPDRAKELVREWIKFDPVPYSPDEAALRFARWLLTEKGAKL